MLGRRLKPRCERIFCDLIPVDSFKSWAPNTCTDLASKMICPKSPRGLVIQQICWSSVQFCCHKITWIKSVIAFPSQLLGARTEFSVFINVLHMLAWCYVLNILFPDFGSTLWCLPLKSLPFLGVRWRWKAALQHIRTAKYGREEAEPGIGEKLGLM